MPDLILELLSEEIPARMQRRAAADLERLVNERLLAAGFMPSGVKAFAGPRRLALVAAGLPGRQPDRKEEKKGPRVGAPEKAVEGFLKSAGLSSLDQCEKREDKKGEFYVAVIEEKGRETASVIADFMPEIIRGFPWPKSMRWGDGDLRWVRPLKSILCCFDGEIVPFEVDGIKAGDESVGHRFLAPAPFRARTFEKYEAGLRAGKVILDSEARAELIEREAKTLCEAQGLELVEDKGLVAEVAGLAEWPAPMMGAFDEKFLAVPDEVLTASMRGHQKYFSVRDPKTGRLANRFVFVANIEAPDGGKAMRAGYERVLTARLSDAWYLYHQDLKTPLEDRLPELDRITFFEGLGSVGDKARRIAALAREIAPAVGADPALAEKAALLAKADLVSQMVREFPELQGVMGRYYALAQAASSFEARPDGRAPQDEAGEGDGEGAGPRPEALAERASKDARAVADAIRDHYKPQGAEDEIPAAPVSIAVALADKIDTLVSFWSIGKKPTGSSDPFALRRAALGVVRLLLARGTRISLGGRISSAYLELIDHGFYRPLHDYRRLTDIPNAEDEAAGLSSDSPAIFSPPYDKLLGYGRFYEEFGADIAVALCGYEGLYPSIEPDDQRKVHRAAAALKELNHRLQQLQEFIGGLNLNDLTDEQDEERTLFQRVQVRMRRLPLPLSGPLGEFLPDLLAFFHDRLKVYLREKGHRHDHIDAVLTRADGAPEDDLVLLVARLEALEAFLKSDDGANLAAGYKRAANILKAEEKKGAVPGPGAVTEKALELGEEKALYAALLAAEEKAAKAVSEERFADAMAALASLRAPIDAFFDKVTVNADDPALRENRLALLARFRTATAEVADLSKLEG